MTHWLQWLRADSILFPTEQPRKGQLIELFEANVRQFAGDSPTPAQLLAIRRYTADLWALDREASDGPSRFSNQSTTMGYKNKRWNALQEADQRLRVAKMLTESVKLDLELIRLASEGVAAGNVVPLKGRKSA